MVEWGFYPDQKSLEHKRLIILLYSGICVNYLISENVYLLTYKHMCIDIACICTYYPPNPI